MQNRGTSTQNKIPQFRFIITIGFILSIVALVFCITGCTPNNTPTDPLPLEPVTEPTSPTEVTENIEFCEKHPVYDKPVIYLYPKEQIKVNVILGKPENITCSYPLYQSMWSVMASPNGDLIDRKTGRQLYSLYYECENPKTSEMIIEGFIVAKEDTISFLEEKLAILGLTEREAEEFIIYWLPKLIQHDYNYIRFASQDEIEDIMPLTIMPTPDTTIRVLMYFKGLDYEIKINEQILTPVERKGFTVVEWGGTELQNVLPRRLRMPCSGIHIPRVRLPKLGNRD
jgi:hypothetical protein